MVESQKDPEGHKRKEKAEMLVKKLKHRDPSLADDISDAQINYLIDQNLEEDALEGIQERLLPSPPFTAGIRRMLVQAFAIKPSSERELAMRHYPHLKYCATIVPAELRVKPKEPDLPPDIKISHERHTQDRMLVLSKYDGGHVLLAPLEVKQHGARPFLPNFKLVDMHRDEPSADGDAADPGRINLQLQQLAGDLQRHGRKKGGMFTDQVPG
ncbi:hypothetical protein WJX72_008136 [[Myrmecia] bisecta]|uniref:Uncharacterized protein n=1 Tax=[Myrmecia] bisecta TaxID=41462 RepID=A0AAW1QRF3_9CHLO